MSVIGGFIGLIVFALVLLALAIPIAIIWLIVEVIRGATGGGRRDRYDAAADALRYRFAKGEITQAEFEAGMRALGYEKR
jgi:uncharacterized membrane protein